MVVAAVVAISVPASVASVVVSTPAWASSSVTCSKFKGVASGAYTFYVKNCTPVGAEKTLSGKGTNLTKVGGPTTYTWKWNGGATTIVSLTVVHSGTCPSGFTGYTDTGTVTGGTSTYTASGDTVQIDVCKKYGPPHMYQLLPAAGSVVLL
jgi:hypothetical protein